MLMRVIVDVDVPYDDHYRYEADGEPTVEKSCYPALGHMPPLQVCRYHSVLTMKDQAPAVNSQKYGSAKEEPEI
jgi:hypothetical protein